MRRLIVAAARSLRGSAVAVRARRKARSRSFRRRSSWSRSMRP